MSLSLVMWKHNYQVWIHMWACVYGVIMVVFAYPHCNIPQICVTCFVYVWIWMKYRAHCCLGVTLLYFSRGGESLSIEYVIVSHPIAVNRFLAEQWLVRTTAAVRSSLTVRRWLVETATAVSPSKTIRRWLAETAAARVTWHGWPGVGQNWLLGWGCHKTFTRTAAWHAYFKDVLVMWCKYRSDVMESF